MDDVQDAKMLMPAVPELRRQNSIVEQAAFDWATWFQRSWILDISKVDSGILQIRKNTEIHGNPNSLT